MRVFDRPAAKIEIELTDLNHKDKSDKECRVTVFMPRGKTIIICETDDDMYKAIDLAHDRLLLQVKRERGRKITTGRRRKSAVRDRRATARASLTVQREPWERELADYDKTNVGV